MAALGASSVPAAEGALPLAAAVSREIASCVDAAPIRFGASDRHALLAASDADVVSAAIARRYPAVQQDGLLPRQLVLWKKPDAGWVFIGLLVAAPNAGRVCFTATFSAQPFSFTPDLVERYFGAEPGLSPEQTVRAGARAA